MNRHRGPPSSRATGLASSLASLARRLVEPARRLEQVEDRRSALMLATCVLVLLGLFLTIDVSFFLTLPHYQPPWFGYAWLLATYSLSRSVRYRLGAVLLAAMFPCVALAHVASGRSADPSVTLSFMALSPLVAALFLSTRSVLWFGLANLCGVVLLAMAAPGRLPTEQSFYGTCASSAITTALALLFIYHRNQREADRQRALLENEERLRLTLEGAQLGDWEYVFATDTVRLSSGMQRMLGMLPGEWGGSQQALFELTYPDDLPLVQEKMAGLRAGASSVFLEHRVRLKDGSVRWVEVRGSRLQDEGRVIGTVADITARRQLENQLRQAQKMEAMGRLAGGVAHDFNNLLTVVLGNVHLLRRAPHQEALEQIEEAAISARALTSELLAFSRQSELRLETVDLGAIAADTLRMLGHLLGERIRVSLACAPDLGHVRADPVQVQQALLNLAANARDAMPDGGDLTIAIDNRREAVEGETATERVCVTVSDSGFGMSGAVLERVFEPFFTTKTTGKGTGLGLTMVFSMMRQASGDVRVESEPGRGTSVVLSFPRVEDTPLLQNPVSSPPSTGHETVLLVEDQDVVRTLCERVLKNAGYHVIATSSAEAARAEWRQCCKHTQLLITDVVMPGEQGPELAARLLEDKQELPILFMSGYAPESSVELGLALRDFIRKPFRAPELLEKVRSLLDRAAQRR